MIIDLGGIEQVAVIKFCVLVIVTGVSTPSPTLAASAKDTALCDEWANSLRVLPSAKSKIITGVESSGVEAAGRLANISMEVVGNRMSDESVKAVGVFLLHDEHSVP